MPPRGASKRGGPRRGSQPLRGTPSGRDAPRGVVQAGNIPVGLASTGAHITTVGVKRPGHGTGGTPLAIVTNSFIAEIPDEITRHYDGRLSSHMAHFSLASDSTLHLVAFSINVHPRVNRLLLKKLEEEVAPEIFTKKTVFDGRKNLFASYELALGPTNSRQACSYTLLSIGEARSNSDRSPKIYSITITKVNEINPEYVYKAPSIKIYASRVLHRFVQGKYSQDEKVLTAIMALNVVVRMDPSEKYPFNVRSFFTDKETKDIGSGIVLWRGYFQSIRPGIGRMFVNVDISTGMMYRPGPLIDLALHFFGKQGQTLAVLSPKQALPDRERLRLQRFLVGVKVTTPHTAGARPNAPPRIIKKLSTVGANETRFTMRDGVSMTVADYFRKEANLPLKYPNILCVEVGSGALIPFEMCTVPPGQIMKKQIPSDKTKNMVEFSTMKPVDRFKSIENGLRTVLSYGQSEYVRDFGMSVVTTSGPLALTARVLPAPTLKYGQGSKQPTIQPRNGSWNMIDKKFYRPQTIERWVVVSYEGRRGFSPEAAKEMVARLVLACKAVGMTVEDENPLIKWVNGHGTVAGELKAAVEAVKKAASERRRPGGPNLIVVVLPDGGNEIYSAVKQINPKLGGINSIPNPASVKALTDPVFPTIVMGKVSVLAGSILAHLLFFEGADVIHPAPGSEGRPSFTSVVGNVDSETAKYIATTRVQTSKQEMIDDLQAMCKEILQKYAKYRASVEKKPQPTSPKRLIFYRELPLIKVSKALPAACAELKMTPKITIIVVGKRHHVRFKTQNDRDADRSGNCPAGTVVDTEIVHPTEFDFFLQSHSGLLGTSRPAHYSVLYDENGFRAKNHYNPAGSVDFSDTASQAGTQAADTLESFRAGFLPLHANTSNVMYFIVS
ncbi:hypothetical protein DXG01_014716 [Tephrocybe rancida]|nr:hypothetical protein DXG01_014716 [Tephrocybe rancida]